ncbi:ThuA domain-containing protein [Stieleria varia]|uniref:ThuA domain-containing protein n=1 Tax=Stieleria varia TaxID=2528005 RepID=UPI001E3CDAC8|nr:ThuA domain-containing protein [Stieleria varia]
MSRIMLLPVFLMLLVCLPEARAADDTKTKIVLIAGQPSHPSGQHEFNAGCILLARALNEQSSLPVHVTVVHNGWPNDESVFENAKAVVIYSDGNDRHPTNGHEEKVDELAASGVGIMCMHYAVEVPPGDRGNYFKRWIGGHYEGGFSCNPHWTAPLAPNSDHPIANGVPGFPANDEWYYNMRWADPKTATDVLTSTPTREKINRYIHWTPAGEKELGNRQTLMWAVQRKDGGRGVGFTGGHWHRNWAIDDFRRVVLNAMIWTAGMEVPEGGVKSEPITEAQLNENLDEKRKMEHISLPSDADLNQPAAEPVEYRWPGKKP